jgi:hypothetical protein
MALNFPDVQTSSTGRLHHWGQTSKNILPTPFFCDSVVSPGIQIADVLAYCVNQRYTGRRGYLEDIFQRFRELAYNHQDPDEDFTLWGVCMVKPDEPLFSMEKSVLITEESTIVVEKTTSETEEQGEK